MTISTIDLSIVIFYLVFCIIIGFRSMSKINNIREYALGQKPLGYGLMIATIFATYMGAGPILGNIEKI